MGWVPPCHTKPVAMSMCVFVCWKAYGLFNCRINITYRCAVVLLLGNLCHDYCKHSCNGPMVQIMATICIIFRAKHSNQLILAAALNIVAMYYLPSGA